MHVEVGARQSGKTEFIIQETLKVLNENSVNKVCIISHNRVASVDVDIRIQYKVISTECYNRITFMSGNLDFILRRTNWAEFHTVFFDEVYNMKYDLCLFNCAVKRIRNGFYIGTPTTKQTLLKIARYNNGNYLRRTRVCRISKKTV